MPFFTKLKISPKRIVLQATDGGVLAVGITYTAGALPAVDTLIFMPATAAGAASDLTKLGRQLYGKKHLYSILLDAADYKLLTVDAPNVEAVEIKDALRWRIKNMIDFPIEEAAIALLDIPSSTGPQNRGHSMFAVVSQVEVIEARQKQFEVANMPVSVIDVPEMAQRNFSVLLGSEEAGVALLSFDASGGLLTVTFKKELYLSRRIDVSLAQLSQRFEEQKFASFAKIVMALQQSLDYCDRQYRNIPVSRLILAPLGDAASSLRAYLAENLFMPVELLDLPALLDIAKVPQLAASEVQQRFFLCLGAALRTKEVM